MISSPSKRRKTAQTADMESPGASALNTSGNQTNEGSPMSAAAASPGGAGDLNCTLRLIRRDVLEQLTIYGNMYRYLPAIAHNQGFRVEEQPVRHLSEEGGTGLFGPGVYVRRCLDLLALMFLTRFTHKPLRFFGALGGAGMFVGGTIALWEVASRLLGAGQTGLYQRPLFLLGVLLRLGGCRSSISSFPVRTVLHFRQLSRQS